MAEGQDARLFAAGLAALRRELAVHQHVLTFTVGYKPYTVDVAALLADRDALAAENVRLRAALEQMVRWFGGYPELIPYIERYDEYLEAITEAREALTGRADGGA